MRTGGVWTDLIRIEIDAETAFCDGPALVILRFCRRTFLNFLFQSNLFLCLLLEIGDTVVRDRLEILCAGLEEVAEFQLLSIFQIVVERV